MRLVSVALIAFACSMAFAQGTPTATVTFDKKPVLAGATVKGTVVVTIPAGLHAYSNPPTEKDLIPLAVSGAEGGKLKSVKYPKGAKLQFAGEEVGAYTGTVRIPVTLELSKTAKGTVSIKLTVHYQLCNDTACFAPGDVTATGKVAVAKKTTEAPLTPAFGQKQSAAIKHPDQPVKPPAAVTQQARPNPAPVPVAVKPEQSPVAATAPATAAATTSGGGFEEGLASLVHNAYQHGQWWIWLPVALLVGILLNLTPCVYPIIAPTAGFIAKQSEGAAGKRYGAGLLFLIGALVVFGAVGTIFGLTGTLFGSLYQKAWFTIGLGALMLVLALSMFDVYQIVLPGALASGLRGRAGLFGALVMGMFIGVAAVPCGGAVIALVAAIVTQTRDATFGMLAFSAMGLGLGLPVGLLILSGSLKVLARPGEWMVTVKHVLGLAVIASGIYFFSFTLVPRLGPMGMAWVWGAYLVAASFYLLVFDHTGRTRAGIIGFKSVVALAATFYGALVLYPAIAGAPAPTDARWQGFDIPTLNASLGKGKPVLVDFRADWCAKCVEIERKTFSNTAVQPLLSQMTLLRADFTEKNAPPDWNQRFQLGTIPVVLFYDGKGKLVRRYETFFDTNEFRDAAHAAGIAGS